MSMLKGLVAHAARGDTAAGRTNAAQKAQQCAAGTIHGEWEMKERKAAQGAETKVKVFVACRQESVVVEALAALAPATTTQR